MPQVAYDEQGQARATLKRLATEVQGSAGASSVDDAFAGVQELGQFTRAAQKAASSAATQTSEAAIRRARLYATQPNAAFGGDELVNAANKLDPRARDSFIERVKLVGIAKEVNGQEYLDQVADYRRKLDGNDTKIFDDQFFGLVKNDIINLAQASKNPTFSAGPTPSYYTNSKGQVVGQEVPGGQAHYFDSPRAEELMKGFYKKLGIPAEASIYAPQRILSQDQEMTFGFKAQIDQLIDDGVLPVDKTDDPLYLGKARKEGAQIAGDLVGKYIEDVPAPFNPVPVISLLPGVSQKDVADKANEVTRSIVYEGTSGPAIASYFVPIVGPTARMEMADRVVLNALIGGFTNAGVDVVSGRTDIDNLATDFTVGAFGAATLPEVMWAFQKSHIRPGVVEEAGIEPLFRVNGYDKETVQGVLRDSGVATEGVASDADGALHVEGEKPVTDPSAPPRVPAENPFTELVGASKTKDGWLTIRNLKQTIKTLTQQAWDARLEHTQLNREYNNQAELRDSVQRAFRQGGERAAQAVPGYEHLITPEDILSKAQRASYAEHAIIEAQDELEKATVEYATKAAEPALKEEDLLKRVYKDILESIAKTGDTLTSTNRFIRGMARLNSAVTGKVAGHIGFIMSMTHAANTALNRLVQPEVDALAREIDEAMTQNIDDVFYVGPAEHRNAAVATKPFTIIQHPEWWSGIDSRLSKAMAKYQEWGNRRLALAQELGYPISAIEDEYLMQVWDAKPEHLDVARRGKVTIARNRAFPDYVTGFEQGLRPRDITVGDLLKAHTKMMNGAMTDAMQRELVLDLYAKRGKGGPISRRANFKSPLYRGYSASPEVVAAVDSANKVQPWLVRGVTEFGQRAKNTTFGMFDLAIFGVQIPHVALFGSTRILTGLGVRFAERANWFPEGEFIRTVQEQGGKMSFYSRAGVQYGDIATGLTPDSGTLVSAVPLEKAQVLDQKTFAKWSRFLADLQFERAMTGVKTLLMDGELFMQHLAGNDITKPEVYTKAADTVNALTLTARPAQSGLRKSSENIAATSANAVRAEFHQIMSTSGFVPIAKAVLERDLNHPELIAAAGSLVSFAFTMYGMVSAANIAQGHDPVPFDPRNGNWGVLWVGNQKVNIIKERAWVRAVAKSWDAMQRSEPEDIAGIWTQVVTGKASPLVGAGAAAAGYGFTGSGGFRAGDLPGKERVLNMLPISPLLEKLVRGDNVTVESTTLEVLGYNNWDRTRREEIDQYVRDHNPYDVNDPRYQDVVNHGIDGLEDAERLQIRQSRPDLFSNDNLSADIKKAAELTQEKFDRLHQLEIEVGDDPAKRREYADKRGDIISDIASRRKELKFTKKDSTLQDKAKTIYYDTLDEWRQLQPGDLLKGEAFGEAEKEARRRVEAKFGKAGLDAVDRSLVVGATKLDGEFLEARQKIESSGYYDAPDALMARMNEQDPNSWPFTSYQEFLDANDEYAKGKGLIATDTGAYKKISGLIDKMKQQFRVQHPDIDALLVIWYGNKPLTSKAQQDAAGTLGRKNLPLSSDSPEAKKSKKGSTSDLSPSTILRLINQ